MTIKEILKQNDGLRRIIRKAKIYLEFLYDAKDFSRNYLEMAEKQGDYKYRLLLLIHNIEKGLSQSNPRPFGKDKVVSLVRILKSYEGREKPIFEYDLACSTLKRWKEFYENKGWSYDGVDAEVITYIDDLNTICNEVGTMLFEKPEGALKSQQFGEVVFSRHSVRVFEDKPISEEDLEFALKCFIEAPTACNRQMCKVYRVESLDVKDLLSNTILGVGGFDIETVTYFVITYDVSAFEFYGERNQGYVNVGLTAMNFANGLHSRGIGSCFLQWSNKRSDDTKVRHSLGLNSSERIGLVLGAGYYKDQSEIPCSRRKPINEIYKVV